MGPVYGVDDAIAWAQTAPMDAVVLDIRLHDCMAFDVASELARRRVPFVFATGYDDDSIPEPFDQVPRLTKPFHRRDPVAIVERMFRADRAAA